jgi:RNA polymerase sigma-70 factor (ECF subfamily)
VRTRKRATQKEERIRNLVDQNIRLVRQTLARVGVTDSDLDDEAQRALIVAARRIDDVAPGAERSFLIQVARNVGAHWHRSRLRRKEEPLVEPSSHTGAAADTPEESTLQQEARVRLDQIIAALPEPLRCVFVRFELEELNLTQIASQLGIPRGTVSSRLRRARKYVRQNIETIDLAWDLGIGGTLASAEPTLLRCESLSVLGYALLQTGAAAPMRPVTRAKALAACVDFISQECCE